MKTLSDLGALVKREHPEYNDLTNEQVGRLVRDKYPDKYGEFLDVETFDKVRTLEKYYNPNRGRLTSWWQRGKAEGRTKLLEVLTQEERLVLEQAAIMEQQVQARVRSNLEFEQFLATHHVTLLQLRGKAQQIEDALDAGMAVETHQEVIRQKALNELEVDKHRDITDITLNAELQKMQEQVRLAIIAKTLTTMQQVNLIQELLDNTYKQIEDIKRGSFAKGTKQRMIEDREELIQGFANERKRLLQNNSRSDD